MARRSQARGHARRHRVVPADLYDYATAPAPQIGRPAQQLDGWHVTDDWPERVPITEHEVDVFEAWFGDILDELFGPV